jgi:hypothetical protein
MRVLKKIYESGENAAAASRIFDDVIRSIDLPLSFDVLEFNVGYGFTDIDGGKVSIGIGLEDLEFTDGDRRAIGALIAIELFRVFVRKRLSLSIPGPIEDILIGRDMLKAGYGEDLTYLFYMFMLKHRVRDGKDFLRLNVPWLIFHGRDEHYCSMFRTMAKNTQRFKHELKTAKLFAALKKDLWDEDNLNDALEAYGAVLNAGN